jgi:hypothetical protein
MPNRIYLIVADETEEFSSALNYVCKAAKANGTHIGVLSVMAQGDFTHWGNIEERVNVERRAATEKFLNDVAAKIKSISGLTATLYVGDGKPAEAVIKTINDNPDISNLFLGASTKKGGPGPLVTYFLGKGIGKLPVPLTIIPDHIKLDES